MLIIDLSHQGPAASRHKDTAKQVSLPSPQFQCVKFWGQGARAAHGPGEAQRRERIFRRDQVSRGDEEVEVGHGPKGRFLEEREGRLRPFEQHDPDLGRKE